MDLNDVTLKNLCLQPASRLYFIGIGGSSMSGLALLARKQGYRVSGSDRAESPASEMLRREGISVNIGHSADHITSDIALVIYTVAISPKNPEYLRAQELGIPTVERGTYLGFVADHYARTAAVCGVHGKTTVTAMLAMIFQSANRNPSVHMGGIIPWVGSNVIPGGSDFFITEACEYHDNFRHVHPFSAAMLNLEPEHLDYFGTFENMCRSFSLFAESIPEDGCLVVCADCEAALDSAAHTKSSLITYSAESSTAPSGLYNAAGKAPVLHLYAKNPAACGANCQVKEGYSYTLTVNGTESVRIHLSVPGVHNMSNSLAAAGISLFLGLSPDEISEGLSRFTGAGRRFELVGHTPSGACVITDYAHHPSEVRATIEAARTTAKGKIIAIFQPHTYSRALNFRKEFQKVLSLADKIILTDIYAAREPDPGLITSKDLVADCLAEGADALYMPDFDAVEAYVSETAQPNDTVLFMGAGTIDSLARRFR